MEKDTGFEKTSQEMSKDDLFDDEDDEQPSASHYEDSQGEEGDKK